MSMCFHCTLSATVTLVLTSTLAPINFISPKYTSHTHLTWNDLMNVHSSVRMPSPLLSSFTSRMTRNRRKKLMLMMVEPCGCMGKYTQVRQLLSLHWQRANNMPTTNNIHICIWKLLEIWFVTGELSCSVAENYEDQADAFD